MEGESYLDLERSTLDCPDCDVGNYNRLGQRPILREQLIEVWNIPWAIGLNVSLRHTELKPMLAEAKFLSSSLVCWSSG